MLFYTVSVSPVRYQNVMTPVTATARRRILTALPPRGCTAVHRRFDTMAVVSKRSKEETGIGKTDKRYFWTVINFDHRFSTGQVIIGCTKKSSVQPDSCNYWEHSRTSLVSVVKFIFQNLTVACKLYADDINGVAIHPSVSSLRKLGFGKSEKMHFCRQRRNDGRQGQLDSNKYHTLA